MKEQQGVLLAELGGTKARLAITKDSKTFSEYEEFFMKDFISAEEIFNTYFEKKGFLFRKAIIGVAAPIINEKVVFTNSKVSFDLKSLKQNFFDIELTVLNDLEMQAYAINSLSEDELSLIGIEPPIKKGPKVLVSPGTGLGLAGIIGDDVVFTEGGHIQIPYGIDTFNLLIKDFFKRNQRYPTFEDFLSGKGITYIYNFLNDSDLDNISNEEILMNKENSSCIKTRKLFFKLFALYLRFAALMWGSLSGVYISGSIANSLFDIESESAFRKAFEESDKMQDLLLSIPIYLVKDVDLGLRGGLVMASKLKTI